MTSQQQALGISALTFTCAAFVLFIICYFIKSYTKPIGLTAALLIALSLMLVEIGEVAPFAETFSTRASEAEKKKNP